MANQYDSRTGRTAFVAKLLSFNVKNRWYVQVPLHCEQLKDVCLQDMNWSNRFLWFIGGLGGQFTVVVDNPEAVMSCRLSTSEIT